MNVERVYAVSKFLGLSRMERDDIKLEELSVSGIDYNKDREEISETFQKRMSYFIDELGGDDPS